MHNLACVRKFYKEHLQKYGEDIRGLGWFEKEEYQRRFQIAIKGLDLSGRQILDIGCGFGGLYDAIERFPGIRYFGIDILPEMIQIARKRHPDGTYISGDFLSMELPVFDYVFCIGSLNISDSGFDAYFLEATAKMKSIARKMVVMNFLCDGSSLIKGPYHIQDVEILRKKFPEATIIYDDGLPGEAFLFIYQDGSNPARSQEALQ